MDKEVLGRGTWYYIHCLAQDVKTYDDCEYFMRIVYGMISKYPCGDCRKNVFEKHGSIMKKLKDVESREGCVLWAFCLHSAVNEFLKKDKWSGEIKYSELKKSNDRTRRRELRAELLNLLHETYGHKECVD